MRIPQASSADVASLPINFREWCRDNARTWPPSPQDFTDYEAMVCERVREAVLGRDPDTRKDRL